jgi:microcin C transport system ATP-binding protein
LLQVHDLSVSFGGRQVVREVSFEVQAGQKLALVGESGSGKTVTALALLGLNANARVAGRARFASDEGAVELVGLPEQRLRGIRGREIGMIFQEPMTALNPLYSVGDQIAEVIELHEAASRKAAWARAVALLAKTGIAEPERRAAAYPHQLSGGQRQRAMIAMALACAPKLLLADEPTTALDVTVRAEILQLLDTLQRDEGMAIVLITHDLNLVRRFADRVAVMEQGHLVEQGPVAEVFNAPAHAYTRRLLASRPQRAVREWVAPAPGNALPPVIKADGVRVAYPTPLPGFRGWFKTGEFVAVHGARLHVEAGQTLGVIGESGSGKSTLAMALLGLVPLRAGVVRLGGDDWQTLDASARRARRRDAQVVFQDPFSSLSPRMLVGDIVAEGLRVHEPSLDAEARRERARAALAEVGMDDSALERYPHEFSGGQRQRIAIARVLVLKPKLVVLDEPTSALDVSIQQQVLALLTDLQHRHGLAYLLITHDVDVIRAMAHRVLVMKDGHIVEEGDAVAVLDQPRQAYTQALVAAAS